MSKKLTVQEAYKIEQSKALILLEQIKFKLCKIDTDFDNVSWNQVGVLQQLNGDLTNAEELLT